MQNRLYTNSKVAFEKHMPKYVVIFEQGKDGGWGAYAPDLPGLGVAAETREAVSILIREGMRLHIEALHEEGMSIPEPFSFAEVIRVEC